MRDAVLTHWAGQVLRLVPRALRNPTGTMTGVALRTDLSVDPRGILASTRHRDHELVTSILVLSNTGQVPVHEAWRGPDDQTPAASFALEVGDGAIFLDYKLYHSVTALQKHPGAATASRDVVVLTVDFPGRVKPMDWSVVSDPITV